MARVDDPNLCYMQDTPSAPLLYEASDPTQIRPSHSEQGPKRSDRLFKSAFSKTIKQPSPPPFVPPRIRSPPPTPMLPTASETSTTSTPPIAVSKHPYSSIAWAELKRLKALANNVVSEDDVEQMEGYNAEVKRFRRWFTPYKGKEACFVFKIYPALFCVYLCGNGTITREEPKKLSRTYRKHKINRRAQRKYRAEGKRRGEERCRATFLATFGSLVQHPGPATRHQARKLLNDFPFAAVALFRSIEATGFDEQTVEDPEPGEIPFFAKGTCVTEPVARKRYVQDSYGSADLVFDANTLSIGTRRRYLASLCSRVTRIFTTQMKEALEVLKRSPGRKSFQPSAWLPLR
jgi:hypothetical protein